MPIKRLSKLINDYISHKATGDFPKRFKCAIPAERNVEIGQQMSTKSHPFPIFSICPSCLFYCSVHLRQIIQGFFFKDLHLRTYILSRKDFFT